MEINLFSQEVSLPKGQKLPVWHVVQALIVDMSTT